MEPTTSSLHQLIETLYYKLNLAVTRIEILETKVVRLEGVKQ